MRMWLLLGVQCLAWCAYASPIHVAVTSGFSHNFAQPLHIFSNGHDLYDSNAEFTTRYVSKLYSVVLGSRFVHPDLDLELHHHKVVLKNPENMRDKDGHLHVSQYQVTNGLNMLTLNYSVPVPWLLRWVGSREYLRFGLGPVISYPISRIDDESFDRKGALCVPGKCGFFVNGGALQASWVHLWSFPILSHLSSLRLRTELKTTWASATVPVSKGYSVLNNKAVHAYVGVQFGD